MPPTYSEGRLNKPSEAGLSAGRAQKTMATTKETKEFARDWIESGKPCRYRYGFGYRGASSRPMTKDEALKLLPGYSFGKGFYNLSFQCDRRVIPSGSSNCTITEAYGEIVLMFNELSANDMW